MTTIRWGDKRKEICRSRMKAYYFPFRLLYSWRKKYLFAILVRTPQNLNLYTVMILKIINEIGDRNERK